MNSIFLKTYYALLFYIVFSQSYGVLNMASLQTPKYVMFASPFNFFNPPGWIHSVIFLFCLLFCLLCILNPKRYLRIAACVFVLMVFFNQIFLWKNLTSKSHLDGFQCVNVFSVFRSTFEIKNKFILNPFNANYTLKPLLYIRIMEIPFYGIFKI